MSKKTAKQILSGISRKKLIPRMTTVVTGVNNAPSQQVANRKKGKTRRVHSGGVVIQ